MVGQKIFLGRGNKIDFVDVLGTEDHGRSRNQVEHGRQDGKGTQSNICPYSMTDCLLHIFSTEILPVLEVDCYTSLHHQQQQRSISLHPTFLSSICSRHILILTILTDMRWNIRVFLICISLMNKDVEHFLKTFSHLRFIC